MEHYYILRNFVSGDEERIVNFFNKIYERFSGYVPRTVEYWRWCCLKRPDVREDGIFLAFDKETGDLEGYAVAGLSGNVWEFCVKTESEDVAIALLGKVIDYLEKNGVSAVNVNVPEDDEVLNEVFKKMGFAKVKVHRLFMGVLSFTRLFSMLVSDKKEILSKSFNEKVCLKIVDAPFWVEEAVSISVNECEVDVFEGLIDSPSILVKTNMLTLLSVLLGVSSPWRAFLSFRMKVKPFWKMQVAKRLFYALRLRQSWFWPLGDFG